MRFATAVLLALALTPAAGVQAQERAQRPPIPRFESSECPFNAAKIDVEGLRCGYLTPT